MATIISTEFWIWKNVCGIAGRCNDVIYRCPMQPPSQDILVYFGGDVQDLQENMQRHADSKKYVEWSLENTAHILSTNFPKKHVIVVRPVRMHITRYAAFSCFDNFVSGSEYGVPKFQQTYNALNHLKELIKSCLEQMKICNLNKDMTNCSLENIKLTLMGFSKGCVVLNQILHELDYYTRKDDEHTEMKDFIKLFESIWWLDGGHGGSKNTWITDEKILESFVKLKIPVNIHVTPYQMDDSHRPWIRIEENTFYSILKNLGAIVQHDVDFADKPRTLASHFNVLKVIKE